MRRDGRLEGTRDAEAQPIVWCLRSGGRTSRSKVVERKAFSMPPRTPCSLAVQKASGSTPPAMPRYTFEALVSLPALTITELIT